MTTERDLDAIYQAKLDGATDESIMKQFSVGLREIEKAVVKKTGTNLNLFQTSPSISRLSPKKFNLESTTVWSFKSRGKWATHNGNYRGNWSPYVPRNVILRYSKLGDVVLDQFCGGGTTAVEAKLLGRKCIARDVSPSAVALTETNLNFEFSLQETLDGSTPTEIHEPKVGTGDARNLHDINDETINLVCTHPPYANIIQFSDGIENDISFHDIEEFIEDMKMVAKESYRVLKPGGVCAILIGDTRRKKKVVPIGFRTIESFLEQGFQLKDLVIKRQHNCRTTGFWYSSSIKHNFLLLAQEYLPIFVKPNLKHKEHRRKTKKSTRIKLESVQKPPAPQEMECKTTWVFPEDRVDELLSANLLNRYGGAGHILKVEIGDTKEPGSSLKKKDYDLVNVNTSNRGGELSRLVDDFVTSAASNIRIGGHLVLRAQDYKQKGLTKSPVLDLWKIPEPPFKIREIIIVTTNPKLQERKPEDELTINHEYLLVYKREELD